MFSYGHCFHGQCFTEEMFLTINVYNYSKLKQRGFFFTYGISTSK